MDKRQVIHIHGGNAFSAHDAFIKHLRSAIIENPFTPRSMRWRDALPEMLGDSYEVALPQMPNKQNAKFDEWRIWFEHHIPFLRDGIILIGHSQGGYFLAKYLSEYTLPVTIGALYLVAAPAMKVDFEGEDGGDFTFSMPALQKALVHVPQVYVFHSRNDFVVPFSHAMAYVEAIPHAQLVAFEDKGHFLMEEFPELVESIKGLG